MSNCMGQIVQLKKVPAGSAGQVNYSGWLRDLIVVYNRIRRYRKKGNTQIKN